MTDGIAPAVKLPGGAQFVRGVAAGTTIAILATIPADGRQLSLFEINTSSLQIRQVRLGFPEAGEWAGLASDGAGNFWAGAGDKLQRVDASGAASVVLTLPPASHPLAPGLGAPQPPPGTGALENGDITTIAVSSRDRVLVGRLGHTEITILDTRSGQFSVEVLPAGIGDVAQLVPAPGGRAVFTVNHSASTAGTLHDKVGLIGDDGAVETLPIPAASLAANRGHLLIGGRSLLLVDGRGASVGQVAASTVGLDITSVALRLDDVTVVRPANSHRADLLDASGNRIREVTYQVPYLRVSDGTVMPYTAPWAFVVVDASNVTWFGLKGYSGVFKLSP
jgi:hypothetical protein